MAALNRIEAVQNKLPPGYIADQEGIHYIRDIGGLSNSSSLQLSHQQFWVEGRLVDVANGGMWSLSLNYFDGLGEQREATISYASLYSDVNAVFADLANQGLCFCTGKASRDQVIHLLMTQMDEAPIPVLSSYGFDNDTGCYALPNNIITPPWHEGPIPRLNADLSKHGDVIFSQGNLAPWKDLMAKMNTPLNIFTLCTGLSNAFYNVLDVEPFGIHLYGASSSGKTMALRAAASLWGSSASYGKTFVSKWGSTVNALELLCAARSGLPLPLDEIRQFKGNFEAVAYLILDGVGKNRMKGNLQQADQWKWRVILISTGELSTADITRKTGGDIFTGAQIRLLDLPIEGFASRASKNLTSEQADIFRSQLGDNFGLSGPEFVRRLLAEFESWDEFQSEMMGWLEDAKEELSERFSDNPAVQRVLPRFALILMTGLLAEETGVLPYSKDEVIDAVNIAIEAWQDTFEAPSDVERAVMELRTELITNAHRIIHIEENEDNNLKPIAYRDEQYIYMTDEHIRAISSHVSVKQIAKALNEKKALHTNEQSRLKVKKKFPGLSELRVYALKLSFLGSDIGDDIEEVITDSLNQPSDEELEVMFDENNPEHLRAI